MNNLSDEDIRFLGGAIVVAVITTAFCGICFVNILDHVADSIRIIANKRANESKTDEEKLKE